MIKRPLVWILGAYLTGMYLGWQNISVIFVIILVLLIFLTVYFLMFHFPKEIINKRDGFLWILPFIMLLAFSAMKGQLKEPEIAQSFEEEVFCTLSGRIDMIVEKEWGRALYVADDIVSIDGRNLGRSENVIVYCTNSEIYLVGNQITVEGTLEKFSSAQNPGQFNEKLYYQVENIDFKMEAEDIIITDSSYSKYQAFLDNIKNKLIKVYSTILSSKESGTLIAMLLGEKYLLDEEIKDLYQENGISHVLAISGLHVSLIGMMVFQILKRLRVPILMATLFSIVFIYSYGVLTDFSVSTNRAVMMMTVMMLSAIFGKTYDMLSAIALSAFLILLQNPLQICSAGFLLSYAAVLGISVVYTELRRIFPSENPLMKSLMISISAQVTTAPFVLFFFYQFPTYSLFINIAVLPGVTVLMISSLIAGAVGTVCLPLGIFLIGGANYILKLYEWICSMGSQIPGNLITVGKPSFLVLMLYLVLLILFVAVVKKYKSKWSILILLLSLLALFIPKRNVGLEITMLSVGQGESIYMESDHNMTYLIDGGSSDAGKVGTYRIQPFLLSQGTGEIDYVIITHTDTDHISGVLELIEKEKIKINNLILPYLQTKDEEYIALETLAAEKGIQLKYVKEGDVIQDDELQITCLHPAKNYKPSSKNAYSVVLSVT
ncbi:MAG: ComEC/Rec2 family competence protein, partial [Mobilitalea sp.]